MKLSIKMITLGLLVCLGGVPQALAEEIAPGITYEKMYFSSALNR